MSLTGVYATDCHVEFGLQKPTMYTVKCNVQNHLYVAVYKPTAAETAVMLTTSNLFSRT